MPADTSKDDFSNEVLTYWIPRLVADGVDANDVLNVRARVSGWSEWTAAWAQVAEDYREMAQERLKYGHRISAGEALVRASLACHVGQVVAFHDPAEKARLQGQKVALFREAAPLLRPPAERIEIPFGNIVLPGYLRLPEGAKAPYACALLVPGLDSTKEDFITVADMCARRGLASFSFDGPGQGEVRAKALLAEGYEACITAAFAAIAARPEIDAARIGALGRSLGGFYVIRAAAAEPRLKTVVVFGGAYDLSDWPTMPKTIRDGFVFATGSGSEDEAKKRMGAATVADAIGKVKCPVLIVHGKRDAIFRAPQASRLAEGLGSRATLAVDEDGVHCCHNHAFQYRTLMADWLAKVL
jgi:2,6-dihydroxypseudooxynicotine hydrolase